MLQILNLQKNFGAVKALSDASLELEEGEIRALLGANGSGKSTLVKVLSGLNKKDGGSILLNKKEIAIGSPKVSSYYKIAMAYQDLSLIPELSLSENLVLGNEPKTKMGFLQKETMYTYAQNMIQELGIQAKPDTKVKEIDLSNQGLVEVAKAMYIHPILLILDEITASMHHDQVERLFRYLRKESEKGLSILFVSHRLEEVYDFCQSATILRGGVSVKDVNLKETKSERLVYYMTGQESKEEKKQIEQSKKIDTKILLEVENLTVDTQVKQVSMRVSEGEIVGIAGLQGQGQSEFLRTLYGALRSQKGSIRISGKTVKIKSSKDAIKQGIGFISGDREKEEILSARSVAENILIVEHAKKPLVAYVSAKSGNQKVQEIMKRLNVVAAGVDAETSSLSGGNQQKLVVGRWLNCTPKLLLLDDPTKGVDVNARSEINKLFCEMTKKGTAILYSSSDNEELLEIAQKVYVFYEGRIIKELSGSQLNGTQLASAMLGASKAEGGLKSEES